jgi:hypothetical protein
MFHGPGGGFSRRAPWSPKAKNFHLSPVFNDAPTKAGNKKLENQPMLIYNNTMNKEIKTFTPGRCDED